MSYGIFWKKKPKWREFYWLLFALNFTFADAKCTFYGHLTGAEEQYFFSKNWKQMCIGKSIGIGKSNQHELVTWWSWYFSVQFISKVVQYSCLVLNTLGAQKLMSTKTMTIFYRMIHFTKKNNIQFQKDDCCL